MFDPDIGDPAVCPWLFHTGAVRHSGNGPAAHGVHGELTVMLSAETDCRFHQAVAADGYAEFIFGAIIGSVHPCCPAGYAAVADQLQAGGKDPPAAVEVFFRYVKVFVFRKKFPHVINADSLAESPFFSSL